MKLLAYGTEKEFKSIADGKIPRCEPDLSLYDCKTHFDTTPDYVIRTIDSFYHQHVPFSPNTRDVAKRRHPFYPSQIEKK